VSGPRLVQSDLFTTKPSLTKAKQDPERCPDTRDMFAVAVDVTGQTKAEARETLARRITQQRHAEIEARRAEYEAGKLRLQHPKQQLEHDSTTRPHGA